MSKISIEGNALGSGTITIAAPNTNSNFTLTLPTASGTVVTTAGAQTIEFAAGTAGAPSITFTGDTNTGIFSPTADTIAFSEGGVEAMRIDSDGDVGIGTTSPSYRLDVSKTTAGDVARFTNAAASNKSLFVYTDAQYAAIATGTSASGNGIAFDATNNSILFTTASQNRAIIDSSGNVTIGPSGAISNDSLQTTASLRGSKTSAVSNTRLQFVQNWNTVNYTASIEGREVASLGAASNGLEFFASRFSGGAVIDHVLTLNQQVCLFRTIGTTASAANAFLDSGNANNLLRSTSSLRFKTDIEEIELGRSSAILNLRPVWYRSLAKADRSDWSWYGLIAEEVAEIEPRLVHWGYADDAYEEIEVDVEREHTVTDENGNETTETFVVKELKKELKPGAQKVPDGVQYDRLTVLLLDVVKRQDASIKALEARIAALETGE